MLDAKLCLELKSNYITPSLINLSITLLDAILELFSSQYNLAEDICPAKSVDHPGAKIQCQTISSNLEVEGFDLINESLTKLDKTLALPSKSRLIHHEEIAFNTFSSIHSCSESFGSGTSGIGTTLIIPSSKRISLNAE